MITLPVHHAHPNLYLHNPPLVQHNLTTMRQIAAVHEGEGPAAGFADCLTKNALFTLPHALEGLPTRIVPVRSVVDHREYDQSKLYGQPPIFVSIIRAGNAYLPAANMLTTSDSRWYGSIGLARDAVTHQPEEYSRNLPAHLDGRRVIVVDPMLASAGSAAYAIKLLKVLGATEIMFVCLLAAPEGLAKMQQEHPDVAIITNALDERLNDELYIIAGLGDAGDLLFGTKKWQAEQRERAGVLVNT